ncbi:WxL domain-containing protein [Lactiplantibacillus garii]|uniref:WxL domain-containing protein n=1 Tax=Lactiplantibacillus garii TaxID=2306423 RepID=A0A3R8L1B8_9LACO|nr:WxL domain-containing protein [Lactiplantibacillus garii]RRK10582.1 WxL domain-containing protein [Lactiplantibacillus garii]
MKKMVSSILMTSALLLGAVAPVVANAADTDAGSTSTGVTFTANTDTTKPVDPTDPNQPLDPEPDENGGKPGAGLALAYAPTTIDFGTHEIDLISDHKYNANGAIDGASDAKGTVGKDSATTNGTFKLGSDGKNSGSKVILEVSDGRGTNAGWALSVTSTGDIANLKGATITLPKGDVSGSGTDKTSAVTSNDVTIDAGSGSATGTTSNVVLNAAKDTGAGVTVDALDPAAITLNVAANTASAKTYSGTLNWSLSDTPAE